MLIYVCTAGPLNYNPVEEWFFHRIKAGRPIPVPNSGQQVPHTLFASDRVLSGVL